MVTIKKGYKETEVGPIPITWELITYDDAFDFLRTAQYSRDQLSDDGSCRYIHYGDIHTKWEHFVDIPQAGLPGIKDEYVKNYSLIKDGDLIMADASEDYQGIGKSVEVKNVKDTKVIAGLHTFLMRDKGNHFVNGYKGYIHSSPYVKKSMDRYATGLKVYGVSKNNLKLIQIPKPSLGEQAAIAEALSDVDGLVSLHELIIAKKKSIKQGAMQQLLSGKKRLQGYKGKWEKVKLGDLLSYEQPTEYLVKGKEYDDSYDTPVLTAGKTFILGYTDEVTGIFKDLPVIIFDDFTTANKYVTFPFKAKSSAMKMLRPRHKEINLRFVFEKMQLIDFKLGDHKRYWISEYQNIELEMPQPDEQTAIATVLSDMDDEITELETRLQKTRELKQGMIQKLLTGSIRLV